MSFNFSTGAEDSEYHLGVVLIGILIFPYLLNYNSGENVCARTPGIYNSKKQRKIKWNIDQSSNTSQNTYYYFRIQFDSYVTYCEYKYFDKTTFITFISRLRLVNKNKFTFYNQMILSPHETKTRRARA